MTVKSGVLNCTTLNGIASSAVKDGNGAEIASTYMKKQDIVDVCNEVINEG